MTVCIDLFAGPGGLGEGFTKAGFDVVISVEKEAKECQTLLYRKLHHALIKRGDDDIAAELASGKKTIEDIKEIDPALLSECYARVAKFELGVDPFSDLYETIRQSLKKKGKAPVVLLGGPLAKHTLLSGAHEI